MSFVLNDINLILSTSVTKTEIFSKYTQVYTLSNSNKILLVNISSFSLFLTYNKCFIWSVWEQTETVLAVSSYIYSSFELLYQYQEPFNRLFDLRYSILSSSCIVSYYLLFEDVESFNIRSAIWILCLIY